MQRVVAAVLLAEGEASQPPAAGALAAVVSALAAAALGVGGLVAWRVSSVGVAACKNVMIFVKQTV